MSAVSLSRGGARPAGTGLIPRVRAKLGRIPVAGRWCFLIALLNAAVWGIVVPPFMVPDEVANFAYAQYVAEHGKPPALKALAVFSPQETTALGATGWPHVIGDADQRGIISPQEQASFQAEMKAAGSPVGPGGTTTASPQPPLYYALAAVPYWISPWHGVLARLAVMRLFSALLAAFTVLFVFLCMRELMPAQPWTWVVGALVVAFEPVVDLMASAVQGDNLLFCVSALAFLCLLRSYRRGFNVRRAVLLGAVVAAGLLTKLTFVGMVPGIGLGVLAIAARTWRSEGRGRAVRLTLICGAVALIPVLAYVAANDLLWHRGGSYFVGALTASTTSSGQPLGIGWRQTLEYIWEFYLPRLGFMHPHWFSGYPLVTVWAYGFVGRLGVLDYTFPAWALYTGYGVLAALCAGAVVGAWRLRRGIRAFAPLVLACLVAIFGLLFEIGFQGVRFLTQTGGQFEQTRYLFPLLVFYGLLCVLAARAFPRRWAPAVGAAIVLLAMAHGLFAETLTISRYYG